jgi:hypothetical protein
LAGYEAPREFAGELFLTLATEGRLQVDASTADEIIAGLENTLDMIAARLRVVRIWRALPGRAVDDLPPELAQSVVDAVFVDQLAPGQLERAVQELPKYIRALRVARRLLPDA